MGRRKIGLVFGVWAFLLLVEVFGVVLNVPLVSGGATIYIKANGSVDPPTAPINNVGNIYYTFTANINDSIVVQRSNVIIDGDGYTLQGSGSGNGFSLSSIRNVTIKSTNIKGFNNGIFFASSSNNNTIFGNTITNNSLGVYLFSLCSNNTIFGNTITNHSWGIFFASSSNNTIFGNTITNNSLGVFVSSSNNNTILGNNITKNTNSGIYFSLSNNNTISENNITDNTNNGIHLNSASNNTISRNNIANNTNYGAWLGSSSYNRIYHNNFINNTKQANIVSGSGNIWDDGYPSGGNYWSDYVGVDVKSGPSQDLLGSDGIGDTPYTISEPNRDRYPLMNPMGSPQPPIAIFTYSPEYPLKGETVTLNASASYDRDGSIASYKWNFGDGNETTVTSPIITHAYAAKGTYTVNLTVTDNDGLSHNTTKSITITEDSTPPTTFHDYVDLWHTSDFIINLTATDDRSGVAETYYKINGGPIQNVSAHGQPCITTESANNTLEYWSVDKAGNEELPHKVLTGTKLDKSYPTIETPSRLPDGDVLPEQEVKVSVNVTDAVSGVKNVTLSYTVDNGTSWINLPMNLNSSNGLYEATIPSQPAGTWVKYKIIVYDNAENPATRDETEPYCAYQVIPEFPPALILLLLMVLTMLAVFFTKKRAARKPET